MNRDQLDLIPDQLLMPTRRGMHALIDWLRARGLQLSLVDLDQERRRRGIPTAWDRPNQKKKRNRR